MSCSSFIFSLFPSSKSDNRRAEQVLSREMAGTNGRREVRGKCVHMKVNAKIPIETTPGIREGGIKENSRGAEFMYDIFDML
jgi:hypothetical protein